MFWNCEIKVGYVIILILFSNLVGDGVEDRLIFLN